MNISCEIIEDLLPLYHDGVCSKESREMVEDHLKTCEKCRVMLYEMEEDINFGADKKEIGLIKGIRDTWEKGKKKSFLKGIAATVALCAVIALAFFGLTQWKCIPVSSDILEVSDVSQLADGKIAYHLEINDDRRLSYIKFTKTEDGEYYMTPTRSVVEGKREEIGLFDFYHVVDIEELNAYYAENGDGTPITSCYVGPIGNGILIWEEGMELPSASDAVEKLFSFTEE